MKLNSSSAVRKTLVVAIAMLALAGLAGTVLAAAAPDQITVHNQDLNTGVILLDSVTAAQDGWVVVYKDPNLTSGEIVGYAPVKAGTNKDVKVTIDTAKVGDAPTLWARLHVDNDVMGVFEWGYRGTPYNDTPVVQDGHFVVTSFATAADLNTAPSVTPIAVVVSKPAVVVTPKAAVVPAPTAVAPTGPIVVKNQDLNSGVIMIDSVTAPQAGWVVVYMDPNNLTAGEIVGYAPVKQGANTDVKVTIDTAKVGEAPTLWTVLQADNGVSGLFEWGWKGQPYNDAPVVENGHNVVAAFGTAADQSPAPTMAPVASVVSKPAVIVTPKAAVVAAPTAIAPSGPIVVKNQELNSGVILIDAVTAPQDGWVVVYKSPNFTAGEIVGYAPVKQGANSAVKVTLDTAKVGEAPTLWTVLQADNDVKGVFEWGWKGQPYNDQPIVENGHNVVATFRTAANQ